MNGFRYLKGFSFCAAALALASCQREEGGLSVEPLLSDGAVLQRNSAITVGGKAAPGSLVTVTADWDFSMAATAGVDSLWSVRLTTPGADLKRHRVVVEGAKSSVCFADILIGEVWLSMGQAENHAADCGLADGAEVRADSMVRFFMIDKGTADKPRQSVSGRWAIANMDNFGGVGQISLAFLSQLRDSLRIPVGVIIASCPGAPSRAWVDGDALPRDMRALAESQFAAWREANARCSEWLAGLPRIAVREASSVYDDYMCVARPDFGSWPRMSVPGKWGAGELPGFGGVVWFAKNVEIPASWRGRRMRLLPGRIGGSGAVYANQMPIGEFDESNTAGVTCIFDIPPGATTPSDGSLSLAFRVLGSAEKGGFYGLADGSPMRIELLSDNGDGPVTAQDSSISLNGAWRYSAVALAEADSLSLFGTPDNDFMAFYRKSLDVPYDICGSVANKMLRPLAGKAVSGVICNVGDEEDDPAEVSSFMPLIVQSVRGVMANDSLRFYFLQKGRSLAGGLAGSGVREAQMMAAASIPRVGVVPTLDFKPVSPSVADFDRQRRIGVRLAAQALADVYGCDEGLAAGCPTPVSATSHNQLVTVRFENAQGLRVDLSRPTAFEVAGADSVFYPARALAGSEAVTVFSHMVPSPVFVRYAHYDGMEPTLFNSKGLPAPSFFFRAAAEDK